jgi:photosystem II stability/assembly factor-like uncharacterized protein
MRSSLNSITRRLKPQPPSRQRTARSLLKVISGGLLLVAGVAGVSAVFFKTRFHAPPSAAPEMLSVTGASVARNDGRAPRSTASWAPLSAFAPPVMQRNAMWLLDYRGRLLMTGDRGEFWNPIAGDTPAQFSAFTMLDGEHGWAAGEDGRIWKTDDSAYNWQVVATVKPDDPEENYYGASQVVFSDLNHGWIVDTFSVWRTADGGYFWVEVKELNDLETPVRRIVMINPRVGWAICQGDLLKTMDGGSSWQSVQAGTFLDRYTAITAFSGVDASRACLAAKDAPDPYPQNVVLCTADGGASWRQPTGFDERFAIYSLFWLDSRTGWAAGGDAKEFQGYLGQGVFFKTEDGGQTWQKVETAPLANTFRSLHFKSPKDGWLASDYDVFTTSDGGRTWANVLSYPEVKERNHQAYYGTRSKTSTDLITRN